MAKDTGLGDTPSATSNRAAAAPNTNERGASRIIVVSHHQPRLSSSRECGHSSRCWIRTAPAAEDGNAHDNQRGDGRRRGAQSRPPDFVSAPADGRCLW